MATSQNQLRKPPLDIVNRIFYWNRDFKSIHEMDQNRITTVAYKYDRKNKRLTYGAVIYRTDDKCDNERKPFTKKGHKMTAIARMTKKPVIIEGVEDDKSLQDFHYKIRQLIYEKGCREMTKKDTTSNNNLSSE
jgi:hypothetical protein